MKKLLTLALAGVLGAAVLTGCSSSNEQAEQVSELTIYSGRSEEFIAPFFAQWQQESDIKLNIRYGDSAELAAQILEEGKNSPADLFLSQDAGSLGAVSEAGLFLPLSSDVAPQIPASFIAANRQWVGLTGRVRIYAFSTKSKIPAPQSITDLTDPAYKGQLGIAPTNASFQAFVTAMIQAKGQDFAKKWLQALIANEVKIYPKNSAIVEAIDKGQISIGLVNHYYIWEVSQALGRAINVKVGLFAPGDLGNLVNVSGIGLLNSSAKYAAAKELINFLASPSVQQKFVTDTHEYSLIEGANPPAGLPKLSDIGAPTIDLDSLKDIKTTQDLLISVGLL